MGTLNIAKLQHFGVNDRHNFNYYMLSANFFPNLKLISIFEKTEWL